MKVVEADMERENVWKSYDEAALNAAVCDRVQI